MDVIARTMADAIKSDPSDGDWVVWVTPTDAAARALRGLEAAGYVVRPAADSRGAVSLEVARDALTDALADYNVPTGQITAEFERLAAEYGGQS